MSPFSPLRSAELVPPPVVVIVKTVPSQEWVAAGLLVIYSFTEAGTVVSRVSIISLPFNIRACFSAVDVSRIDCSSAVIVSRTSSPFNMIACFCSFAVSIIDCSSAAMVTRTSLPFRVISLCCSVEASITACSAESAVPNNLFSHCSRISVYGNIACSPVSRPSNTGRVDIVVLNSCMTSSFSNFLRHTLNVTLPL